MRCFFKYLEGRCDFSRFCRGGVRSGFCSFACIITVYFQRLISQKEVFGVEMVRVRAQIRSFFEILPPFFCEKADVSAILVPKSSVLSRYTVVSSALIC